MNLNTNGFIVESLLVHGEPGIGKTTLMGELSLSNKIIYISLRNRSIKEVLEYLTECYRLQFNKDEDIFLWFNMMKPLRKKSHFNISR